MSQAAQQDVAAKSLNVTATLATKYYTIEDENIYIFGQQDTSVEILGNCTIKFWNK